jgi:hypothetical protein
MHFNFLCWRSYYSHCYKVAETISRIGAQLGGSLTRLDCEIEVTDYLIISAMKIWIVVFSFMMPLSLVSCTNIRENLFPLPAGFVGN